MTFLFVLFCVMLSLMLFPLLLGHYSREAELQEPLLIKSDNAKDPRYFPKSFREKLESAMAGGHDSGVLHLSKDEKVCRAEGTEFTPDYDVNEIVISLDSPLNIPPQCRFQKEIYSAKDVAVDSKTVFRALAGLQNVTLSEGVQVIRWVDAEDTLATGKDCSLGISATAGKRINLELGCTFYRLFAPQIHTGSFAFDESALEIEAQEDTAASSDQIFRQDRVSANEKIAGSVISNENLILASGCEVTESVHADKNVRVCSGAVVRKNVFADGDIVIENDVTIYGDVFAQGSIFVGEHCRIGTPGQTKSLVARNSIALSQDSMIFGYVGSEMMSSVVTEDAYFNQISVRF